MSSIPHSQSTDAPLPADRNYWATFKNPVVSWDAKLAPPAELGIERVFDFTRRILAAAEQQEIMRVIETPPPSRFKREDGWTWYDYVRERFEREGRIYLFPSGGGPTQPPDGRQRTPALLAYYKGTDIVEEEVEDPGLLLRALHQTKEHIGRYSVSPIVLRGASRTGEDWVCNYPPDKLWISLSLFTDIWFPRIIGWNAEDPIKEPDGLMDNSALARRHTPRLNRFIETLRDAVLELGGTWCFDRKETDSRYLPMIHDGGINLDPPRAHA